MKKPHIRLHSDGGYTKKEYCHHGKVMSYKRVDAEGRTMCFSGGLPPCCREEMKTPAEGSGFIIMTRDGNPKKIYNPVLGKPFLVDR